MNFLFVIKNAFKDFAKQHLTAVLIFWGFVFLLLGLADDWVTTNTTISELFLSMGSAILGGGVFAVILKSQQFTDVFRKHIFEVFYTPQIDQDIPDLRKKWEILTRAILSSTIPQSSIDATTTLKNQFLKKELQYHFENFESKYEIRRLNDDEIEVKNTVKARVIVAKNHEDAVMKQTMSVCGDYELLEILADEKVISHEDFLTTPEDNKKLRIVKLPLSNLAQRSLPTSDRYFDWEKTVRFTQKLSEEPYIAATVNRYVRGFTLKVKVEDNSKEPIQLHTKTTGLSTQKEPEPFLDANGFKRWVLAPKDDLLLPGQGYIVILNS